MTYAQFLVIFILPVLGLELFFFIRSNHELKSYVRAGLCMLCPVAFFYTTPWDNYLVKSGIWTYEPERVLGRVGWVPIEEYLFFILQTCLTGLWCYFVGKRLGVATSRSPIGRSKYVGIAVLALAILWAASSLLGENREARYLALILVWALPVVLLQWWVGADFFAPNWRVFLISFLPTTLYLVIADTVAVNLGVWRISPLDTLGFQVFGLPVEEAIFFALTNVMVCLGLIFFMAMRYEFPALYARLSLEVK